MGTNVSESRTIIDLSYTNINAKIGCDLPETIQLVENNLTWCNTQQGVHFLANTSAAYENNVVCLSPKINYSDKDWTDGLLADLRQAGKVFAHDDDRHYWLVVDDHVWLWDYFISNYKNPSWFYFDNIFARGLIQEDDTIWELDNLCNFYKFQKKVYFDYPDQPIDKVFRFSTTNFNGYLTKTNVNEVLITFSSDSDMEVSLTYLTDLEEREDLTPLEYETHSEDPEKIHNRFGAVFCRKPHCWHVQFFAMRLEANNKKEMALVSAQVYYNYQGMER